MVEVFGDQRGACSIRGRRRGGALFLFAIYFVLEGKNGQGGLIPFGTRNRTGGKAMRMDRASAAFDDRTVEFRGVVFVRRRRPLLLQA